MAWFAGLDWGAVLDKKLPPPVQPDIQFDADTYNFDDYFTRQPAVDSPAAPLTANDLFRGAPLLGSSCRLGVYFARRSSSYKSHRKLPCIYSVNSHWS